MGGKSGGRNLRFTMGGAWDEQLYMALSRTRVTHSSAGPNFGFRCVRFDPGDRSPVTSEESLNGRPATSATETPVDDKISTLIGASTLTITPRSKRQCVRAMSRPLIGSSSR